MEILFINPWDPSRPKGSNLFKSLVSSADDLICRSLAAAIPKNHSIAFVDELLEDIDYDSDVDLVALTTFTQVVDRAYEIADEFRKRGKKVVIGGWHVTALPEEGNGCVHCQYAEKPKETKHGIPYFPCGRPQRTG